MRWSMERNLEMGENRMSRVDVQILHDPKGLIPWEA